MEQILTLTPEQLFFLGTLMGAEYINYEYIASLGELHRNYSRTRRKCLDELVQAGIVRERLSGEVTVRPAPKTLLNNVFFGKTESSLEVFTLGRENTHALYRFHRWEDSITLVRPKEDRLALCQSSPEQMESLVSELVGGAEHPAPAGGIQKDAVSRILTVKQATVGTGSTGMVLFEQFGGLYTVNESGEAVGIPASRAGTMIMSQLKGE